MRVSTQEQAREGFSIPAQKEKLTAYCKINDWNIYSYYIDDGISGKNIKDRPELSRLIEDIKNNKVTNVLIYKLDRLTRSVKDLISLIDLFEKYKCDFSSVTEKLDTSNAVGRMFIKIIGIFAEFERENLAERVSFGYEEKTKEGNYTNTHGVYGYDYIVGKGNLVINTKEKEIVKRVYDMYLNGTSMMKIAKVFNVEKVSTKRGGTWSQSTIKSILTNPLYSGKIRYGVHNNIKDRAFVVNGSHDTIIDIDTFERVQKLIEQRKHFCIKKYASENAYFAMVLRCAKCGARFHPKQQKQNNKIFVTYYCNNKQIAKCDSNGISHKKVLKEFDNYISNIKLDETISINHKDNNQEQKKQLLKQIESFERKRKRLQQLFIDEQISNDEYKEMILNVKNSKNEVEDILKELQAEKKEINYDSIKNIITDLKKNWDNLGTSSRYAFVNQFIKFISLEVSDGKATIKEIQFN